MQHIITAEKKVSTDRKETEGVSEKRQATYHQERGRRGKRELSVIGLARVKAWYRRCAVSTDREV